MKWLVVGFAVAALMACVRPGDSSASLSPMPLPTASVSSQERPSFEVVSMPPADKTPQPPQSSLPALILDPILADAATRAGVALANVTVVSSEAVTWPDGGLGCPLPGVEYPQVPVDGYRVVVEAAGQRLDYRGRGAGDFRLCESK